ATLSAQQVRQIAAELCELRLQRDAGANETLARDDIARVLASEAEKVCGVRISRPRVQHFAADRLSLLQPAPAQQLSGEAKAGFRTFAHERIVAAVRAPPSANANGSIRLRSGGAQPARDAVPSATCE